MYVNTVNVTAHAHRYVSSALNSCFQVFTCFTFSCRSDYFRSTSVLSLSSAFQRDWAQLNHIEIKLSESTQVFTCFTFSCRSDYFRSTSVLSLPSAFQRNWAQLNHIEIKLSESTEVFTGAIGLIINGSFGCI